MSSIKNRKLYLICMTVMMVFSLILSFIGFNATLSLHMNKDIESQLQESVEPNIVSFNLQMEEQIKKVKMLSDFLGENWYLSKDVHVSLLKSAADNNGLLRCALAYTDGSFITSDGRNEGNITNDEFFIANMNGDFFITDPRPAVVDKTKQVMLFAAPIIDLDKKIVGSLIYSYLCEDMSEIFNLKSMGGEMNIVVTKENGELLIGASDYIKKEKSLVAALQEKCTHKMHKTGDCLALNKGTGVAAITTADTADNMHVRYDKLKFNDWYMLATIPDKSAMSGMSIARKTQQDFNMIVVGIITVYIIAVLFLLATQRKLSDIETCALTITGFKKHAKKIFKNRTSDSYVVIQLDVKDFKLINRMHSFAVGDKVIKNIAESLKLVIGTEDCAFARVGVDVFVFLLPYEGLDKLAVKRALFLSNFEILMGESFTTKIIFPTGKYTLQPSDFPRPDINELLEKVNFAHAEAKGKPDIIIDYESDIESAALFEKSVEDRMEKAIRDEEFTLYLQPKISLKTETICGAEALVRWEIEGKIHMYPIEFVPILEKNGFIVQLDKYMFECAVKYIRGCMDRGVEPVTISVNFSRLHLSNKSFIDELCEIADEYGVPRHYLEIELTESTFMNKEIDISKFIIRLHKEGFTISMDDFGTGYSCFAQLKDLNIDILKIDKGFFDVSEDEGRAETVVAGIINIAQQLNITTVAEGIEEKSQMETLKALGCDIIQGYYYSRPMPAKDLKIDEFIVKS